MDSSFFMQKQIRENSEELRSFVTELQSWEEDMKRKDQELLEKSAEDLSETYPAVRNKTKRSKSTSEAVSVPKESKKISGYDYAAWDKFDVEKVCAEMDVKEKEEEEEEKKYGIEHGAGDEGNVESRDQAVYEKELGNEYVKKQRWKEAIMCYSRAIICYPYDAAFYANRALCYLKTSKTKEAEADCTTALQLDDTYVKAFQRRGLARVQLRMPEDAREDFLQVLRLDPSNSAAKSELTKMERKLASVKAAAGATKVCLKASSKAIPQTTSKTTPVTTSKATPQATTSKTASKASAPATAQLALKEDNRVVQEGSLGECMSDSPRKSGGDGDLVKEIGTKLLKPSSTSTTSEQKPWAPSWARPSDTIVDAFWKPAHLRSKKPLKTVVVKDVVDVTEWVQRQEEKKKKKLSPETHSLVEVVPVADSPTKSNSQAEPKDNPKTRPEVKREAKLEVKPQAKLELKPEAKSKVKLEANPASKPEGTSPSTSKVCSEEVPPPPASSVQFLLAWKQVRDSGTLRHRFLKQLKGEALPLIFREALESKEFSEVLGTLSEQFAPSGDPVYPYLLGFTQVKRFAALVMFMSAADKTLVKKLISHCDETGQCSTAEAAELYKKFEIKL